VTPHLRFSFFLHALLLLVALTLPMSKGDGEGESPTGGSRNEEPLDVTIVDPPSKEEEVVVLEDEGIAALKKIALHAGDKCEHFYGGIGVIDGVNGVTEVYPGYPAANAGMEVGDLITSGEPIRGEVGTPVTITVLRGLRRLTFHLIRDKICVL
jgi:hypothetical protein